MFARPAPHPRRTTGRPRAPVTTAARQSERTCPQGLVARIALQLPASQAQRPPQSMVLGAHCIVHITSVQSGFCAAGTQLAG